MKAFDRVTSPFIFLPTANIDTDQIIPARFLKITTKSGLGERLFHDWRYHRSGGVMPEFPLNQARARQCQILVAGDNFGCGSSREHAPWSLLDFGFRVVVSTRIADIFKNNALKNGLLPVEVPADFHRRLALQPQQKLSIDLEKLEVTAQEGFRCSFQVEPFARHCLLQGMDPLDFLLSQESHITQYEEVAP